MSADEPMTLSQEASRIGEHSPRDTNIAVARAALSLLPGGGLVGEALGQIPTRRAQRMDAFAVRIAETVEAIREEMDEEFVRSGDFADLVEDVLEAGMWRSQAEKVEYYATAVANSVTRQAPERAERDRMLDLLERLRLPHLDLLAMVSRTTDGAPPNMMSGGIETVIEHVRPGVDMEALKMDWADLAREGVLQSFPNGTMSRNGVTDLSQRMTPFGKRFHRFIGNGGRQTAA